MKMCEGDVVCRMEGAAGEDHKEWGYGDLQVTVCRVDGVGRRGECIGR